MNATAVISAEIQVSDIPIFEALFKRMKAKKIIIKSKEDDTEMTQEAFFDKIDKASKQQRNSKQNICNALWKRNCMF